MTQATKTATVEEYMALVKEGDHDKMDTFIEECFGTGDDQDVDACIAFTAEVQAPLEAYLTEEVAKMPEATEEMLEGVEVAAETEA